MIRLAQNAHISVICVDLMQYLVNQNTNFAKMNQKLTLKSKLCHVCGDEAAAFYHNGLTCHSCKMFFRRNFARFEELKCKNVSSKCRIDKISRSYCPKSRLDKCFDIGMRHDSIGKNSVTNNLDFENLNQLISVRINQSISDGFYYFQSSIPKYFPNLYPDHLTPPELELIREVQLAMQNNFTDERKLRISRAVTSKFEAFNLYSNYVRKVIKFCKNVAAFKSLNESNQLALLKGAFFEISIVRRVYHFNPEDEAVRLIGNESGDYAISVEYSHVHGDWPIDKRAKDFQKFKRDLHLQFENDETLRDLIIGQILFRPRANITCPEFVNYEHIIYSRLVRRYLHQKFSQDTAEKKFYYLTCLLDNLDLFKRYILELISSQIDMQQLDQVLKELLDI